MEEHRVVPDVIDKAPSEELKIQYGEHEVNNGAELTPTQVQDAPVLYWNAENNAYYFLIMTDPDTPRKTEFCHWIVANIPGNKVEKGEVLSAYVGAGPPKKTGLHRYIFLLYKQPEKIHYEEKHLDNKTIGYRMNFSTKKFAEKYKLGNPVAGNLFRAQYDDYVPKLYARISVWYRILNFIMRR